MATKTKRSDIPRYELGDFRHVHRAPGRSTDFGCNQLERSKFIDGFELYSSHGLVGSVGPLRSAFYRVSITVTGELDMQIGLEHYRHQPRTLSFTFGKGMGEFAKLSLGELREGFEEKFWSQLETVQSALPYLRPGGSVTLITAISAVAKLPGVSGLAAVNGALELMVPIWAREWRTIRVNAVSPGVIDTPWWILYQRKTGKPPLRYIRLVSR
jgi:NAD(P)-dependent dehydrogenase (short-subunit alcohol dehydrogenase family)